PSLQTVDLLQQCLLLLLHLAKQVSNNGILCLQAFDFAEDVRLTAVRPGWLRLCEGRARPQRHRGPHQGAEELDVCRGSEHVKPPSHARNRPQWHRQGQCENDTLRGWLRLYAGPDLAATWRSGTARAPASGPSRRLLPEPSS